MAPYPPGLCWPRIQRRLRGYNDELVQLLRELTAIPALGPENGGEGEQAKARYLQKKLKALNPQRMISLACPDHRVPSKNRPNILALFAGRDPGRTVRILSHRARRLPAAVWMTTLETAHQPHETALLSRMIGDAQVLAHIFCHN